MSDVTNYDDLYESLSLILEEEAPDSKQRILNSLDDAVGNHADMLHMESDRSDRAVPLDEIIHYGQHVGAIFILSNGAIIAAHDWYTYNEYGTYKVYSGGDNFHITQDDVEQIATRRFVNEVVLDE